MALVRNIAGIEPQPGGLGATTASQDEVKALFSGICQVVGGAVAATPTGAAIMAIRQGIDLLPPGKIKDVIKMLSSAAAFVQFAKKLIEGRPYTTGQYRLAERYLDQVLASNGPDSIKSYRDVPDDYVPEAILFFTVVFGVRITTDEDLWALDSGATAYLARPGIDYRGNQDATSAAIQRAVYLKQTYFPSSTYNVAVWDLNKFAEYPLASPIPDPYTFGKLYSGPLPGGGTATDGLILVNADTPLSGVQTGTGQTEGGQQGANTALLWIGGALAALGLYYYSKKKKPKLTIYG